MMMRSDTVRSGAADSTAAFLVGVLAFATPTGASMEPFLSVSAASWYQAEFEAYVDSLVRQGHTRPGWCLIGLKGGVPVARAAQWGAARRTGTQDRAQ
jgi:hypothetical protein